MKRRFPPTFFGNTIPSPSAKVRDSPATSTVTVERFVDFTPRTRTVWQIGPVVARGRHAPFAQVVLDVGRGQAEAGSVKTARPSRSSEAM